MVNRMLKHLFMPSWLLWRYFPPALLAEIETAIRESEIQHHGEIRFAVETSLPLAEVWRGRSGRQAAVKAFSDLAVWDTENNSGVLIYLLLADHDLEIVADRGIAAKVDQTEWDNIAKLMEQHYRAGDFRKGTFEGIRRVSESLAQHFPPGPENPNELSNKPVLLKR
jgi:uncharacterized membrane protein